MQHPRLLIILNRFVIGGQAVDTLPLASLLSDSFDILIVYGEKEQDEIEATFLLNDFPRLRLKKISQLRRSINPFSDIAAFFQLLAVIVSFKPQIVHTHGAKSGVLGRLAAFLCRVPAIVHTFHGHLFHSYFKSFVSQVLRFVERTLAKLTSGFVVLSQSQYIDLVEKYRIIPKSKVRIIPLGVLHPVKNALVDPRAAFRTLYNVNDNEVAIGIVGRIVPIKNHRFFVEAANLILKADGKRPVFFVIGDGDLKHEVQNYFDSFSILWSDKQANLNCRVVFTSWLSDISQVMQGLDIVVLTSLNEGTPLSLIEAQAYGKPVVATNVGGVKDSMVPEVSGFMVAGGDLNAFCARLKDLINNVELRNTMGTAGQRFVYEQFSKQREVEQTKDFYFSLLSKK